jgi:nucleotide-binding universal stress UspA family protein
VFHDAVGSSAHRIMMTARPRSILVAVDFGEASARAVALGGALAERCGASLRLLHAGAFDVPPYMTSAPPSAGASPAGIDPARATEFLADFGRRHAAVSFISLVDDGSPVDAILRESATSDLVVMGTHGRRGLSRWWLGSVAERVLRETGGPLLIAHAEKEAVSAADAFTRILVHASPPLSGKNAAAYAAMLADGFGGEVVDARYEPLEPALERTHATLLTISMPADRGGAWQSNIGEPIVRFCERPILFVPEA